MRLLLRDSKQLSFLDAVGAAHLVQCLTPLEARCRPRRARHAKLHDPIWRLMQVGGQGGPPAGRSASRAAVAGLLVL